MAASLVKFPDKLDSGVTSEIAKDENGNDTDLMHISNWTVMHHCVQCINNK